MYPQHVSMRNIDLVKSAKLSSRWFLWLYIQDFENIGIYILNSQDMLFHPAKLMLKVFSIYLKSSQHTVSQIFLGYNDDKVSKTNNVNSLPSLVRTKIMKVVVPCIQISSLSSSKVTTFHWMMEMHGGGKYPKLCKSS